TIYATASIFDNIAITEVYTLALHDALPIYRQDGEVARAPQWKAVGGQRGCGDPVEFGLVELGASRDGHSRGGDQRRFHPELLRESVEQLPHTPTVGDGGEPLPLPRQSRLQTIHPGPGHLPGHVLDDPAERHLVGHDQQRHAVSCTRLDHVVGYAAVQGLAGGHRRHPRSDEPFDEQVGVLGGAPPHQAGEHERACADVARGVGHVGGARAQHGTAQGLRVAVQYTDSQPRRLHHISKKHDVHLLVTVLDDRTVRAADFRGVSCVLPQRYVCSAQLTEDSRRSEESTMHAHPTTRPLVIRGAHVVSMDAARAEHRDGYVVVSGNRIVAVGSGEPTGYDDAQIVDGTGCVLTPGLINTHHH